MTKSRPTIVERCFGRCGGEEHRRRSFGLGLLIGFVLLAVAVAGCLAGSQDSQGNRGSVQSNGCVRALDQAERTFAVVPYPESVKTDAGFVLVEEAWAAVEPCLDDVDERTRVGLEAEYTEAQRSVCTEVLSQAERVLRGASGEEPVTVDAWSVLVREKRAVTKPCFGMAVDDSLVQLETSYAEAERDLCLTIMGRTSQIFDDAPLTESGRINAGYVLVEKTWAAARPCLGYADESALDWLETSHGRAQRVECLRVLGRASQIYDDVVERDRVVVELTRGQLENAKSASEPCLRWADADFQISLNAKSENAFAVLPNRVNRASSPDPQPTDAASARPAWCRHYDAWERAFDAAERLKARNSDFTADWSQYDLLLLEGYTDEFVFAASRMWAAAPVSEDWSSAHRKCG